jgi:type IV pilus assembly protein PilV
MSAPGGMRTQRGFTLIEVLVAVIVLSVGILAVFRLFPAGLRSQTQNRMQTAAAFHAQEKLEQLACLPFTDSDWDAGTHPTAGPERVGPSGQWTRSWQVEVMDAPLDDLKRVTVTVTWAQGSGREVVMTSYRRRGL